MLDQGDADEGWQRRKSARIFALEEKEKEKRKSRAANDNNINRKGKAKSGGNVQPLKDEQLKHHGSTVQKSSLKRGRKQKRLEDIDVPYLDQNQSQEDGEDSNDGNLSTRIDQYPNGSSSMPEKRIVDFALAVLQKRDTYDIFAQPVDPDKVENYYTIIKEPMDFGTVKTKLQKGKYTSLEQFKGDVFLICSNAMQFNEPSTVYYKEARAMQVLARGIFSTLRTDPNKLESEFSLTKGRPAKKATRKSETKNPRTRTPRSAGVKIGTSSHGLRDGDSTFPKREDPRFCMPRALFCSANETLVSSVYDAKKILELNGKGVSGYKQSLVWFVRGLGPLAKREAVNKLIKCVPRVQTPSQTTHRLLSTPFFTQQPVSQNDQFPITPLRSSPGSSNILCGRNTLLNLNAKPSSAEKNTIGELGDLMPPPREPISQIRHNHLLGKTPMLDNNIAHGTGISQSRYNHLFGKNPMLDYYITNNNKTSQSRPSHLLGKMPMLDNNIAHNTTNSNIFGSSSREVQAYPSPNTTINLRGNTFLTQNITPQKEPETQIGKFWLASHLKVMPVEDPNNPYSTKFATVDLLAEPEDQMEIQQGQESGCDELSANWKSRLRLFVQRGNNYLKTFDLFGSPMETPTRLQGSGSSSARGMASGDHGQYLINSNNYTNNSKPIGQSSEGYFSRDEFATLQRLMNNKRTPLPSYDELAAAMHERAVYETDHRHERVDIDQGPNLCLQL